MRIRTKLIVITMLPVVLALVVGVIMALAAWRLQQLLGPVESARDAVVASVFELSVLTHEYVQTDSPRVIEQWQTRHASLRQLLLTAPFPAGTESTRQVMQALHRDIGELFAKLRDTFTPNQQAATAPALVEELRAQRVGRLLTLSQQLVALSTDVGKAGERERGHVMRVTYATLVAVVIVTAAGLVIISVLVSRSMTRPFAQLHRGTELVGKGELSYRINNTTQDEIGELARAFDRMTQDLQEVTVSRDELVAEVERRRRMEQALAERNEELKELAAKLTRSNEDLAMFAYAASHDLQEPLRAVSGFVQLLGKRSGAQLDERSREYIALSVEGTQRMQTLIHGLLDYSRITTRGKPLAPTNTKDVLDCALENLRVAIGESHAQITHDSLPVVMGDAMQLTQVFQNLIGNALKFRGDKSPRVHVGVQKEGHAWRISVSDNGIGLEPEYADRIFLIFQRLHTRKEYPGNGIGLALCKKIVERHGGRIWVESQPGAGATFHFTIPNGGNNDESKYLDRPSRDDSAGGGQPDGRPLDQGSAG